ncbi:MAG: elongation factor G [Clostridia bacterium]
MSIFETDAIRNIAILGHTGLGKTSLAEAMLFNAGMINRLGKVDEGQTTMDYDDEEIKRKSSIGLSMAYLTWKNCKINILDTPGFFDFEGEQNSALHVVAAGIIVTSACGENTVGTEKAIEKLNKKGVPAILFINQLDKDNYDYNKTLTALKEVYGNKLAVIQIPILEGNEMKGYVDVLQGTAKTFKGEDIAIPANLQDDYKNYKTQLTEIAAESDDELLDKYFNGGALTTEQIIKGVKKRQIEDGIILVMGGSAIQNRGVISLMDEIISCMRSPKELAPLKATDAIGCEKLISIDDKAPFSAQVFKSIADAFVGKVSYLKVISGVLKTGDVVTNANAEKQEKIGQLYIVIGKKLEPVEELRAGDIGACSKLLYTNTSDTLCDNQTIVKFNKIAFPKANIGLAITSVVNGEEEKVIQGLNRLKEEDYTFYIEKNTETGETLIYGLGETQLEILCKKLKNKFKVEAKLSTPKIAYRETIKKIVEAQGKHRKQSGGHGQYGDVVIRFEPCEETFVFEDEIVGGVVPKQYIPAVEKGLRECVKEGILLGYPLVNVKCVLTFGSYHDVDSSEMAFKIAASLAYKKAIAEANPVLLEPIEKVEIIVPESYMGDILGDLNKRRGKILGMDAEDGKQIIKAEAPLSEMFKYSTDLRSLTQAKGEFSMSFLRYDEVPQLIIEKLIKAKEQSNL